MDWIVFTTFAALYVTSSPFTDRSYMYGIDTHIDDVICEGKFTRMFALVSANLHIKNTVYHLYKQTF